MSKALLRSTPSILKQSFFFFINALTHLWVDTISLVLLSQRYADLEAERYASKSSLILLKAIVGRVFLIVDKSIISLRFLLFSFVLFGFCRRIRFPSVMFSVSFCSFTISMSSSVKADIYMARAELICSSLMFSRPHAFPFFRHDFVVLTSSSVMFFWLLF